MGLRGEEMNENNNLGQSQIGLFRNNILILNKFWVLYA